MLTNSQLQTLKSDIAAKTQAGQPLAGLNPNNADHAFAIAAYYNANASPSFWVWKNSISSEKTGMVVDLSEVGGLTTANSNRLQVSFIMRPGGFTPSNQSDRALFGSVFSSAGGALTRAAILAAWQRLTTRGERLFSTGTGTQATVLNIDGTVTGSPGSLVFEGSITHNDVLESNNV
jgi:hypothetical protein